MRTFLDSNVILSAFKGDEEASEQALGVISDGSREFVASDYLRLELYPNAVFRGHVEQQEFFDRYFRDVVEIVKTSPKLVADALALAGRHELGSGDALLAQAAIEAQAREFVTTESPSKPLFRIPSASLSLRSLHHDRPRSRLHRSWSWVKARGDRIVKSLDRLLA